MKKNVKKNALGSFGRQWSQPAQSKSRALDRLFLVPPVVEDVTEYAVPDEEQENARRRPVVVPPELPRVDYGRDYLAVESALLGGFTGGRLREGLLWLGYDERTAERVIAGLLLTGILDPRRTTLRPNSLARRSPSATWHDRLNGRVP